MTPREYEALFKVWRDKRLTLRVAYSLCGMTDGSEFEEYQRYLAMMPQGSVTTCCTSMASANESPGP